MKIKTFSFFVSDFNHPDNNHSDVYWDNTRCYPNKMFEMTPDWKIDNIINEFIENIDLVDIKVNNETINQSGCTNTVKRTYTILYK